MSSEEQSYSSWIGALELWTGVLLPPIVWAIQMQLNYTLVRASCNHGKLVLHLVTIVASLSTVLSGLLAWRSWRRVGMKWPDSSGDVLSRSRFMAVLGILSSAMFLIVILAQGIANILFQPCQQ